MQEIPKDTTRRLTARQVLALKYWREDKFRSRARAMRKAGYSESMARQPHKLFGSPAVQRELFYLGLGDRVSRNMRESGKTFKEWRQEVDIEEKERKIIDEAIQQITPEQLSILRDRLVNEVGYDPNAKMQVIDTPVYYPKTPNVSFRKIDNFSSM